MRIALLLLLQLSPSKATIEGTVMRAGSSDPISAVRVTLTRPPEPRPATPAAAQTRPPAAVPTTTTDAQGKFILKDVDAGTYRVTFAANGYVRQEQGPFSIVAGQNMKGVTVSMTRTANISGRVFDTGNQPVAAVPVHLMRFAYDANGRKVVQPAMSTQSDDRGEYRLYFLTPGHYYLAAGMLREATPPRPFNGSMDSYTVTYYPGTTDVVQATTIDIKAGAELNVDVSMKKQTLYRIRGRVVDSRTGTPPSSVLLSLTPRGGSGGTAYEIPREAIAYNATDGSYEVRDVLPGSYLFAATWGDSMFLTNPQIAALGFSPPNPQAPRDPEAQRAQSQQTSSALAVIREGVAYASVSVGTTDIENLVMSIVGGGTVTGHLRIDDAPAGGSSVTIQMKTSLDGAPTSIPAVFQPRVTVAIGSGTFSMPNIKPGEYRVSVEQLPRGYYVKEAHLGPNDALNRPFQFNAGDTGSLEILVVPGAPSVSGTALNERLEPAPGAQVVLVPERLRDRIDLYKLETADARGQFTFNSVTPGDYKVFAWEGLEPNAYLNPDVLKQQESRGKIIHVQENSAQTVDVRVFPF